MSSISFCGLLPHFCLISLCYFLKAQVFTCFKGTEYINALCLENNTEYLLSSKSGTIIYGITQFRKMKVFPASSSFPSAQSSISFHGFLSRFIWCIDFVHFSISTTPSKKFPPSYWGCFNGFLIILASLQSVLQAAQVNDAVPLFRILLPS